MWNELPLQQLVLRLAAMVIIAGVHGIAVAATAVALGDPGPRYDGRLRLNPFIHLDLLGTASGVLFVTASGPKLGVSFSAGVARSRIRSPAEDGCV